MPVQAIFLGMTFEVCAGPLKNGGNKTICLKRLLNARLSQVIYIYALMTILC